MRPGLLLIFLILANVVLAEDLLHQVEKANELVSSGDYRQALERGLRIAASAEREKNDKVQARALILIADAHWYLGDNEAYREYVEKALAIYLKIGDVAGTGASYYNLAFCYELTAPDRMILLLDKAMPYALRAGDRKLEMRTHNAYATAFYFLGRYQDGIRHLKKATRIAEELGDTGSRAVAQNNLCMHEFSLGFVTESISCFQEARSLHERAGRMQNAAAGNTIGNLGSAYFAQGDLESALKAHEEALRIHAANGFRRGEIIQLQDIAQIKEALGEQMESLEVLGRIRTIAEEIGDSRTAASALTMAAQQHRKAGRLQDAEADANRALEIASKGKLLEANFEVLPLLAQIHTARNEYPEALSFAQKALELAQKSGQVLFEAEAHAAIGEVHRAAGRIPRAIEEYRLAAGILVERHIESGTVPWYTALAELNAASGDVDATRAYFDKSLSGIDRLESMLSLDRYRVQWFQKALDAYQSYARWELSRGNIREAWQITEQGRARVLKMRLAQAVPPLNESERAALARINALQTHLREADSQGPPVELLLSQLAEAEAEYDRVLQSAHTSKTGSARETFELPANTIVVEYVWSAPELWIFSARNGEPHFRSIPGAEDLLHRADFFEQSITADMEKFDRESARDLYRALLEPELRNASQAELLIIPDASLHHFPFAALVRPDGKFLIESLVISVAPSLGTWRRLGRQESSAASGILAAGNTTFAGPLPALPPLPAVKDELRDIQAALRDCDVLLDQSERAIKETDLSRYAVVHFATHTLTDELRPERSSIVFSGDGRDDGYLQAREIYRMRIPARLVVLSGCRTGSGKTLSGEGVVGLSHALYTAGARSIVMSLWDVSDAGTRELMREFYRRLPGLPVAEALRMAQLRMIASRKWSHPSHWAAFVTSGAGLQRIPVSPSRNLTAWMLGVAALIALLLLAARIRSRRSSKSQNTFEV